MENEKPSEPELVERQESIQEVLNRTEGNERRKGVARRYLEDERIRKELNRD